MDDGTLFSAPSTVTITVVPFSTAGLVTQDYTQNFESAPDLSVFSSVGNAGAAANQIGAIAVTTAPNGQKFLGLFGNQTVSLNLTNINEVHNAVKVSFDVYLTGSWEGAGVYQLLYYGPDQFLFNGNGIPVLDATFNNYVSGDRSIGLLQSYPNNYPSLPVSNNTVANTGASSVAALGYTLFDTGSTAKDAIYHLTYSIPSYTSTFSANITASIAIPTSQSAFLAPDENS